jgi:hypothetical protein
MPEISLPDIKLPDIRIGDAKLRDVKLPDLDLRDRLPDVDIRELHMPDVKFPDRKSIDSAIGAVQVPDFKVGERIRDLRMPEVDVDAIRRLGRPEPRRRTFWPFLLVAVIGAAFAAWWLATSSLTGPRVRAAADKVRQRFDELRGGTADWADSEEKTETFWSSETGWQEATPGTMSADAEASRTVETDPWQTGSAATQPMSDAGMGGTAFEGDTGDLGRSEASEREG